IEQTVFDCTLMDSLKNYYEYRFTLLCGLPEVTLHGSPDDFQSIIARVDQLAGLIPDLRWWLEDLIRPHLYQLLATANGQPDLQWWSQICHRLGGGSDISLL